jgi:hypothetical protein
MGDVTWPEALALATTLAFFALIIWLILREL